MRVSLTWLKDYVDLPETAELAKKLTAVGLEVEAIEKTGGGLEDVVAARILSSERHPDAEKLSVTRVDIGEGEPLQIVCGAKNYAVGDVVPLAKVGAVLPGGQKIEKAKLRGVPSFGMLCSARELALSEDASGLLILEKEVVPGTPIAKALLLEDVLLEVNVTPNRPDALSHLGIAREVAAILGERVRLPQPNLKESRESAAEAVKVRIEAPDRCARYAARVVEGVRIGPSPLWLRRRLEACGVRSISNVVDATNFVLLELGHPLHAFDLDKVVGGEIVVRTARPNERLVTLDGKERLLEEDDLVIADRDRASALAGVMGGGDSEISAGTTRVLLESAFFAPGGVRRTSRRHGLKTEASYRFERGADPEMVLPAIDRCAALIAELGGGTVRRGVVDAHPRKTVPIEVELRFSRPRELLGIDVSREEARRILLGLGFVERRSFDESAIFEVPSYRVDVSFEEDLIEEIVRTLGYEAIPETLPATGAALEAFDHAEAEVLSRVRAALESQGFAESVNFSFVSEREVAPFLVTGGGDSSPEGAILLKNPISTDLAAMRTSLVPSLLKNAALNRSRRVEDLRLYEVARTYRRAKPPTGKPSPEGAEDAPAAEELRVGGVLLGRRSPAGWAVGNETVDLNDAKVAVEATLQALSIGSARYEPGAPPFLHPRHSAKVLLDEKPVGFLGELHPRVAQTFDLPRGVYAFEILVEPLVSASSLVPRYRPIPRFPAVLRDLAVVVAEGVPVGKILAAVQSEPLVEAVSLFDVYRGSPIPEGKKNVALAIRYRAPQRTLTDAEAEGAHAKIVARLAEELGAELRG